MRWLQTIVENLDVSSIILDVVTCFAIESMSM
jgi:hypothetical protein